MTDKLDQLSCAIPDLFPAIAAKRKILFSVISFDVTPGILRLLQSQYQLQIPSLASWVGQRTGYHPMRLEAGKLILYAEQAFYDRLYAGEHMIVGNDLFRIDAQMRLTPCC